MEIRQLTWCLLFVWVGCSKAIHHPDDPMIDAPPEQAPDQPDAATADPVRIEPPMAATTPRSLSAWTFAQDVAFSELVRSNPQFAVDVLEQRIVTQSDHELALSIVLIPPVGSYARQLVSDGFVSQYIEDGRSCSQLGPNCLAPLTSTIFPASGPLAARWRLTVVEDATNAPIDGCSSTEYRLDCTLPAGASAAYRVIVSTYGLEQLWDGTTNLQELYTFTGAPLENEVRCIDPNDPAGTACTRFNVIFRFKAMDRARLTFEPIEIAITADGRTLTSTSPALTWDAGDEDLPGPY
jgi:hypothetical protein